MDRVEVQHATVKEGKAAFGFKGAVGPGRLSFVGVMNLSRSRMGVRASAGEMRQAVSSGIAGQVDVPVFPEVLAEVTPEHDVLIPGMTQTLSVQRYAYSPKETTDGFLSRFVGRTPGTLLVGDIYQPVAGKVHVTIAHDTGSEVRTLDVGVSGGAMKVTLDHLGTYAYAATPFSKDHPWHYTRPIAYPFENRYSRVIDPEVIWLNCPNSVHLYETVDVAYNRYTALPTLDPARFGELYAQGGLMSVVTAEPGHARAYEGAVRMSVSYRRGNVGYLLDSQEVEMKGRGEFTFEGRVPGLNMVTFDHHEEGLPQGKVFTVQDAMSRSTAFNSIQVRSDLAIRVLPNKDFYFSGDRTEVVLLALSNGTSGTDVPIQMYLKNTAVGDPVTPVGGSASYDLGTLEAGKHELVAVMLSDPVVKKLIELFGLSFLGPDLTARRTVTVRDLAMWVTVPHEVVLGETVTLTATVLEGEQTPLAGGYLVVEMGRSDGGFTGSFRTVWTGLTDDKGLCVPTFEMPDVYLDLVRITVRDGKGKVSEYTGGLQPRAHDVRALLWTDKPIYRGDDTIHARLMAWDADALGPLSGDVRFTLTDPLDRDLADTVVPLDGFGLA
ncbi:MAG: hypothetical protein KAQ96_09105, partial [Thermoplasmata archaeon]|nr:hypothetical protein [Thermoplasmata archaeon]